MKHYIISEEQIEIIEKDHRVYIRAMPEIKRLSEVELLKLWREEQVIINFAHAIMDKLGVPNA